MRSVTWAEVYARRLRASHLDEPGELPAVVRDVLGVHAQLLTGAELALSARAREVTRERVAGLLWERRELVKGNTIRGTLHLHTPEDYALWKGVYPDTWRDSKWLDFQGLTLAEAEYLREAVLAVLDEPRTRSEIGRSVGGRLGERIAADSWGHLLAPSSRECCQGPPRGREVTFVRCDRWLEGWQPATDPLPELVRRYVETYGPVRRDELEHWFACRLPDDVLDGYEEIDVEGHRTFVVPGTAFPDVDPHGVRLLWHYDVYVIACHPRDHLIPQQRDRIFLRGAGPSPTLLVDGQVAGTWTRTQRGRRFEIRVETFDGVARELAAEAERVARTYGATAELT